MSARYVPIALVNTGAVAHVNPAHVVSVIVDETNVYVNLSNGQRLEPHPDVDWQTLLNRLEEWA